MSWNITHLAHYHYKITLHVARLIVCSIRARMCYQRLSAVDAKKFRRWGRLGNAQKKNSSLSNDQKSVLHTTRAVPRFFFSIHPFCSLTLTRGLTFGSDRFFLFLLFKRANTSILFTKVGNFCHVAKQADFINAGQKFEFLKKCLGIINSTKVSIHHKVAIIRHHGTSLVDGLHYRVTFWRSIVGIN